MCGIAGFNLVDGDIDKINTAAAIEAMGLSLMARGTDATGVMTVTRSDRWKLVKDHNDAKKFFADHPGIGDGCRGALVHTRAATQGSAFDWGNNHPINYNKIVGIHNGVLWNDDDIFEQTGWKRHHRVDSEAIFAALHHDDTAVKALERIDGSYAIAWFDTSNLGVLHMARGSSSPLIWALTVNGSVFFASTEAALEAGMRAAGMSVTGKFSEYTRVMDQGLYLAHDRDGETEVERLVFTDFDGDGKYATYTPGRSKHRAWSTPSSWEDWEFHAGRVSPPREPLPEGNIIDGHVYEREQFNLANETPAIGELLEIFLDELGHTLRGEVLEVNPVTGECRVSVIDEIELNLDQIDYRILKGV